MSIVTKGHEVAYHAVRPLLAGKQWKEAVDVATRGWGVDRNIAEMWVANAQVDDGASAVEVRAGESNPKHAAGRAKPSAECAPLTAAYWWAFAHENGAGKYGAYNWRDTDVQMSVYIEAAKRHLALLLEGEWVDVGDEKAAGSGAPHAAMIMACMAIVIDAHYAGTLINDSLAGKDALRTVMTEIAALRTASGALDQSPLMVRKRKISDSLPTEEGLVGSDAGPGAD